MSKEAMKLALDALEWMVANDDTNEGDEPIDRLGGQSWNEYNSYWLDGLNNARVSITALREALLDQVDDTNVVDLTAPVHQEPVACISETQAKAILDLALDLEKTGRLVAITEGQERTDFVASYNPPAQRKPLMPNLEADTGYSSDQRAAFKEGWEAAEAAHGIKDQS